MVVDNSPINVNNELIENVEAYVCLGQRYSLKERNQDKKKQEESWQAVRHPPKPCHLPEETGVQLMRAASYDIWCSDLDTDQTSTEHTFGRTDQN